MPALARYTRWLPGLPAAGLTVARAWPLVHSLSVSAGRAVAAVLDGYMPPLLCCPAEFDNLLDEFLEVHGQSKSAHEVRVVEPLVGLASCLECVDQQPCRGSARLCTQCTAPQLHPGLPLSPAGQCAVPIPQAQPGAARKGTNGMMQAALQAAQQGPGNFLCSLPSAHKPSL